MELGGLSRPKKTVARRAASRFVEHPMRDVGYALPLFVRSPGFTAAVVLSLALGIGANTAVFSLINALMWRQIPVERSGRRC